MCYISYFLFGLCTLAELAFPWASCPWYLPPWAAACWSWLEAPWPPPPWWEPWCPPASEEPWAAFSLCFSPFVPDSCWWCWAPPALDISPPEALLRCAEDGAGAATNVMQKKKFQLQDCISELQGYMLVSWKGNQFHRYLPLPISS